VTAIDQCTHIRVLISLQFLSTASKIVFSNIVEQTVMTNLETELIWCEHSMWIVRNHEGANYIKTNISLMSRKNCS